MELDIMVVNSRHFTSKKDNKVYNTLDFILVTEDAFINNDKFVGYIPQTAFFDKNILTEVKPLTIYKGVFENKQKGLKSYLELQSLKTKDGKVITLA